MSQPRQMSYAAAVTGLPPRRHNDAQRPATEQIHVSSSPHPPPQQPSSVQLLTRVPNPMMPTLPPPPPPQPPPHLTSQQRPTMPHGKSWTSPPGGTEPLPCDPSASKAAGGGSGGGAAATDPDSLAAGGGAGRVRNGSGGSIAGGGGGSGNSSTSATTIAGRSNGGGGPEPSPAGQPAGSETMSHAPYPQNLPKLNGNGHAGQAAFVPPHGLCMPYSLYPMYGQYSIGDRLMTTVPMGASLVPNAQEHMGQLTQISPPSPHIGAAPKPDSGAHPQVSRSGGPVPTHTQRPGTEPLPQQSGQPPAPAISHPASATLPPYIPTQPQQPFPYPGHMQPYSMPYPPPYSMHYPYQFTWYSSYQQQQQQLPRPGAVGCWGLADWRPYGATAAFGSYPAWPAQSVPQPWAPQQMSTHEPTLPSAQLPAAPTPYRHWYSGPSLHGPEQPPAGPAPPPVPVLLSHTGDVDPQAPRLQPEGGPPATGSEVTPTPHQLAKQPPPQPQQQPQQQPLAVPLAARSDGLVPERRGPTVAPAETRGSPPADQASITAVPCTAPAAVRDWLVSGGLDKLQVTILEAPGGVPREQQGLAVVSEDVNFGVRAISDEPAPPARLPAASVQQPQQQQEEAGKAGQAAAAAGPGGAGSQAAAAVVRASLRVVNRREDAVTLVNVRAMPQYSHCLRLHDQAGVAVQDPIRSIRHRSQAAQVSNGCTSAGGGGDGLPAVLLPPGAEYSVDVILNLSKDNFASSRAERGLLAQLVLFTFVFDGMPHGADPSAIKAPGGVAATVGAPSTRSRSDVTHRGEALRTGGRCGASLIELDAGGTTCAAVVGGRVAVAVVDRRRLLEVNSLLKATAPPFIPKVLRQLFSTPPKLVHSCAKSVAEALFTFENARSVVTCAAAAAAPVTLALRALITATCELPPPPAQRPPARSVGPFGRVPPIILSAVNGAIRPTAEAAAAAAAVPALSAAAIMGWAQKDGVSRPAVARLEELEQYLSGTADTGGGGEVYGAGGGSLYGGGGFGGGWALLWPRQVDASQTTWGKQLLPSTARILQEARRALEDAFEAAAACATAGAASLASVSAEAATPFGAAAAAAPAAAYQRSELLRYGRLLVEEEDVMEHDIRTFTLYNARVRVAHFSDNMLSYRVLNWPPFAQPQQNMSTQQLPSQPVHPHGDQNREQPQLQQTPPVAVSEVQEGADVAPAVPRPYRGPRLQRLCSVAVETEGAAVAAANGSSGKPRKGAATAVAASGSSGSPASELLLAAVVEVPGLVEERPRLVAGDLVFVRLEAQRHMEYVAQLLTVDAGQVLLVMPPEYWRDVRGLARPQAVPCSASGPAGAAAAGAAAAAPLAHCSFSFDRTPFARMHEALLRATLRPQQQLLPPPPTPPGAARKARLPDLPDDLYYFHQPERPAPNQHHHHHHLHHHTPKGGAMGASGDPGGFRSPWDIELAEVAARLRLVGGTALNPEQRLACAAMLCGAGRDLPFVLFGPPGTGKTVTLVECALQILAAEGPPPAPFLPGGGGRRQRSARLLLAAPQNYSADLITSSLGAALGSLAGGGRLLRLNDPRRRVVEAKADVLPYCLIDDSTAAFRLPNPREVQLAQVVVCSCSSAGILHEGSFLREALAAGSRRAVATAAGGGSSSNGHGSSSSCFEFTHVLVDEAGQALLPEVLIPLTLCATGGAAMLCGDPRQLEPVVRSAAAARGGLATSLLELLMESARREGHLDRALEAARLAENLLSTQQQQQQQLQPAGCQHDRHHNHHPSATLCSSSNGSSNSSKAAGGAGRAPPAAAPLRGVMLVRNYRSAAPLLDLPSRLFYDQQLKACVDAKSSRAPEWDLLVLPSAAATTNSAASASSAAPHSTVDGADGASPGSSQVTAAAASPEYGIMDNLAASGVRTEGELSRDGTAAAAAAPAAAAATAPREDDVAGAGGNEMEIVAPSHLLFFGVRGQQYQELDAPSYFNPLEASTVADLVDSLIKASWAAATQRLEAQRQRRGGGTGGGGGAGEGVLSGVVNQHDIGIICTYRKQVFKMRQLLRDRGLGGVRVGTVDDYQGQEERIIFISTVLSNVESLPGGRTSVAAVSAAAAAGGPTDVLLPPQHPLGLWSHPRRFNVAVTRCRALLVVVGHPAVLLADKYWRELVRQCVARGTYRGAGEALVRRRMRQDDVKDRGGGSAAGRLRKPEAAATASSALQRRGASGAAGAGADADVSTDVAAVAGLGVDSGNRAASGAGDADTAVPLEVAGEYDVEDEYDDENDGGANGESWEDDGEEDGPDAADLAAVVQQLAEMATLGMGCEDEIYPDMSDLDAFYEQQSAYFEEMPFRVQL